MIKKKKIRVIRQKKGNIIKFFDFNKIFLKKFEEIYFSEVKKNYFKGWKLHKKRNQIMTISAGTIDFFFKNKINGKISKIRMSYPNKIFLLFIPKNTFYCFKCLSKKNAMIVNIIDEKII